MTDYTITLHLGMPNFNQVPWHDIVNNNFKIIDSTIRSYLGTTNIAGLWENSTAYTEGQVLIDEDNGQMYICEVGHTSVASPTSFEDDRTAHPTYWRLFTTFTSYRGEWATTTDYDIGDFVVHSSTHEYAVCNTMHTSDTWAGDSAYWDVLIDMEDIFAGDITVGGELTVDGALVANSTLDVTGLVTADDVTVNGTLTANSNVEVGANGISGYGASILYPAYSNDKGYWDTVDGWALRNVAGAEELLTLNTSGELTLPKTGSYVDVGLLRHLSSGTINGIDLTGGAVEIMLDSTNRIIFHGTLCDFDRIPVEKTRRSITTPASSVSGAVVVNISDGDVKHYTITDDTTFELRVDSPDSPTGSFYETTIVVDRTFAPTKTWAVNAGAGLTLVWNTNTPPVVEDFAIMRFTKRADFYVIFGNYESYNL